VLSKLLRLLLGEGISSANSGCLRIRLSWYLVVNLVQNRGEVCFIRLLFRISYSSGKFLQLLTQNSYSSYIILLIRLPKIEPPVGLSPKNNWNFLFLKKLLTNSKCFSHFILLYEAWKIIFIRWGCPISDLEVGPCSVAHCGWAVLICCLSIFHLWNHIIILITPNKRFQNIQNTPYVLFFIFENLLARPKE